MSHTTAIKCNLFAAKARRYSEDAAECLRFVQGKIAKDENVNEARLVVSAAKAKLEAALSHLDNMLDEIPT